MRKAVAVSVALVLAASAASQAAGQNPGARLQGTFTMKGVLTTAVHVFGEHRGQHVQRSWTFVPQCQAPSCARVELTRQRSGKQIPDTLMLTWQPSGSYVGRGHFWVALRCAGQIVPQGGRASEKITVRITHTTIVGTTTYATAISATYTNRRRKNLTRCPGGIGHDAASYHGQLVSSLP